MGTDIESEDTRVISRKEAEGFARSISARAYFECPANFNVDVDQIFETGVRAALGKLNHLKETIIFNSENESSKEKLKNLLVNSDRKFDKQNNLATALATALEKHKTEIIIKTLFVGDIGTGKTTLRYLIDQEYYQSDSNPALSYSAYVNYSSWKIKVSNFNLALQIYDIPSLYRFKTLLDPYSRGAQFAAIFFDSTTLCTLEVAERWAEDIDLKATIFTKYCIPKILICTKIDLLTSDQEYVKARGLFIAEKIGALEYLEYSAKTGEGVKELLFALVKYTLLIKILPKLPPEIINEFDLNSKKDILEIIRLSNLDELLKEKVDFSGLGFFKNEKTKNLILNNNQAKEKNLNSTFSFSPNTDKQNSSTNAPLSLFFQKSTDNTQESYAALASYRAIRSIQIDGIIQRCRIVAVTPNGNCWLIAIQRYLQLIGKAELAEKLNRAQFIETMNDLNQQETIESDLQSITEQIFKVDGATGLADWKEKFSKDGYWLQDAHFKFLSYYYNLKFHFYYLNQENEKSVFQPEPGYECIYIGRDSNPTSVHIAHVSTDLTNKSTASLNHFESIIINPTPEQEKQIDDMMAEEEEFYLKDKSLKRLMLS